MHMHTWTQIWIVSQSHDINFRARPEKLDEARTRSAWDLVYVVTSSSLFFLKVHNPFRACLKVEGF